VTKHPPFFADPGTDRLYEVMLNIAQEIWVQEERLLTLEGKSPDDAERDARESADRPGVRAVAGGVGNFSQLRRIPNRHNRHYFCAPLGTDRS
jgi:hypothetical protein